MKVNQISTIINNVWKEITGETDIIAEDLSNVVEVGAKVLDLTNLDNYCKALVDHVGKVSVDVRELALGAPNIMVDAWEYGAALERIHIEMPETSDDPAWTLSSGATVNQDVFTPAKASATFWQRRDNFQIASSITTDQLKSAFSSAEQLNAFLSGIQVAIENRMRISLDALIMRTINNYMAETIHADYPDEDYLSKSGVKAVNLLKLYNDEVAPAEALTADKALYDPQFLRFAASVLSMYTDRLASGVSKLFNVSGVETSTPKADQHMVLLSNFDKNMSYYMEADVYNAGLVQLPEHDTVAFWQGSGQDYSLAKCSTIHVTTASGDEVVVPYVLGTIFDRMGAMVSCLSRKTTTHYNGAGDFTNFWYKVIAGYINDLNYNCVVFFMA